MKIPRDLSARELIKLLRPLGYEITRQKGSHIRLTHAPSQRHLTIPDHDPLKPGTLQSILREVATHNSQSKDDLLQRLFG